MINAHPPNNPNTIQSGRRSSPSEGLSTPLAGTVVGLVVVVAVVVVAVVGS